MSWLLDVNMILASRWATHVQHAAAKSWIDSASEFYTCAISELGFVRISLSAAYQATWEEAQESLGKLHRRAGHRFLPDDVDGCASPASYHLNSQVTRCSFCSFPFALAALTPKPQN